MNCHFLCEYLEFASVPRAYMAFWLSLFLWLLLFYTHHTVFKYTSDSLVGALHCLYGYVHPAPTPQLTAPAYLKLGILMNSKALYMSPYGFNWDFCALGRRQCAP